MIARHRKTIVAVVGAVLTWALVALDDSHVSTAEWVALAVAVATGLGVYRAPNAPAGDVIPDV